jgi:predicted P-loop ATPase
MSIEKKRTAIAALIKANYVLFPLSGSSKIPPADLLWRNVVHGQYTVDELMASNYAIALGPDDLVLDFDPRSFPKGDNVIKRFTDAVGIPLTSFTVRTGGGGAHVFYKVTIPEGMVIVGNLKKAGFLGIDTKHHGGYVVGPGSVHPDTGQPYQIVRKSPAEVDQAPQGVLNLVFKVSEDLTDVQGTGVFVNDEQAKTLYTRYLEKKAPLSIQGQGGNANAFVVAARGRDYALSSEIALDLLLTHWDDRCSPPWGEHELRGIVKHAYRYATSPVGSAHPDAGLADFQNDPLPAEAVVATLPAVIGLPDAEPQPRIPGVTAADSLTTKASVDVSADGVDWATTANGVPLKNFQNLINYLKAENTGIMGIFGFNEFTQSVEFASTAPWHRGRMPHSCALTDSDLKHLKAHLAVRHTFERSVGEIEEAVTVVAWGKSFHPVREYLDGLVWDGVPRLDFWLRDHLGVEDSVYTRAVARKTLCAAVARVYFPGCKADSVLILEGEQDIGKSTVIEILGGQWAADFAIDPHDKDTVQKMQGKWIIELAEMVTAGRSEEDALKAFLTRKSDRVRLPYGRLPIEYPRQSIFISTKNPGPDGTYLKDDTGNRRWWPVMCHPAGGIVDFKAFKAVRNQLWAEAVMRMKAKPSERLDLDTRELKDAAKAVSALRHAEHPWTERIGSWLDGLRPQKSFVTAREVFVDALQGIDKQLDRRATQSIASALKALGWRPVNKKAAGARDVRGFHLPGGAIVTTTVVESGIEDLI